MERSKINRINELSKKSRTVGLTAKEMDEQKVLRKEYIASFRGNLKNQLDSLVIVDEHGNEKTLKRKQKEIH